MDWAYRDGCPYSIPLAYRTPPCVRGELQPLQEPIILHGENTLQLEQFLPPDRKPLLEPVIINKLPRKHG